MPDLRIHLIVILLLIYCVTQSFADEEVMCFTNCETVEVIEEAEQLEETEFFEELGAAEYAEYLKQENAAALSEIMEQYSEYNMNIVEILQAEGFNHLWEKVGPGKQPKSNYFSTTGFRIVNPQCYVGRIQISSLFRISSFPDAAFHAFESIDLRRRNARRGFYPHHWHLWTDPPFRVANVITSVDAVGEGSGKVRLEINLEHGLFRLVTDVNPRMTVYDYYTTTTAGPVEHTHAATEQFFSFADHHYSYLSKNINVVSPEIKHLLLSDEFGPPPNVMIGMLGESSDREAGDARWLIDYRKVEKTKEYMKIGEGTSILEADLMIFCLD